MKPGLFYLGFLRRTTLWQHIFWRTGTTNATARPIHRGSRVKWMLRSAKAKEALAQSELRSFYQQGFGTQKQKAASYKPFPEFTRILCEIVATENDPEDDNSLTLRWFIDSTIEQGDGGSIRRNAEDGNRHFKTFTDDCMASLEFYIKSATQNHNKDYEQAFVCFKKAADKDNELVDTTAQFEVGECLWAGCSIEKALERFKLVAKAGNIKAAARLCEIVLIGRNVRIVILSIGFATNSKHAVRPRDFCGYIKENDNHGQCILGRLCEIEHQRLVDEGDDILHPNRWYLRAAQNNHVQAQLKLAVCKPVRVQAIL
ncbi:hypothetical protein BC937DRAFT_88048 [Endogone sp. FLAS-F59071]|nr:hypothetical protein BC937DRAFT_88048 [Endogone sp. FLAS-F59071]|eukprot:RUS19040.1 hypothetical protein BC937DRAFT_88048 [Endogone sp. FLAS-F59071]